MPEERVALREGCFEDTWVLECRSAISPRRQAASTRAVENWKEARQRGGFQNRPRAQCRIGDC